MLFDSDMNGSLIYISYLERDEKLLLDFFINLHCFEWVFRLMTAYKEATRRDVKTRQPWTVQIRPFRIKGSNGAIFSLRTVLCNI